MFGTFLNCSWFSLQFILKFLVVISENSIASCIFIFFEVTDKRRWYSRFSQETSMNCRILMLITTKSEVKIIFMWDRAFCIPRTTNMSWNAIIISAKFSILAALQCLRVRQHIMEGRCIRCVHCTIVIHNIYSIFYSIFIINHHAFAISIFDCTFR